MKYTCKIKNKILERRKISKEHRFGKPFPYQVFFCQNHVLKGKFFVNYAFSSLPNTKFRSKSVFYHRDSNGHRCISWSASPNNKSKPSISLCSFQIKASKVIILAFDQMAHNEPYQPACKQLMLGTWGIRYKG